MGEAELKRRLSTHHIQMALFGLTGGIASGKSTAARIFEELGARIIDADRIGHELLSSSHPAYQEVLQYFGDEILDSSREINRKLLGGIVFANPEKLNKLNAIVHPKITERVNQMAAQYQTSNPFDVVLVDAALIFEAGLGGKYRKVIFAWCRPQQQIERLMAKTGLAREEAERRINAQMPVEEKRRRADFIIDCSGGLENTRIEVEKIFPILKDLAAGK